MLVDRYVVELVTEAGAGHEVGAHVERDGHQLVVGDLALVVGDEHLPVLVDPLDHEVRLDDDALLLEQRAEGLARDRLGERAVERGDKDDLGAVAKAAPGEEVVGEEGELQRCDGALDRHLGDVHDEATAAEACQPVAQGERALVGVELADLVVPLRAERAGDLVGARRGAGGDDQLVVGKDPAVGQAHCLRRRVDPVDLRHHQLDAVGDERALVAAYLFGRSHPERQEEVARLVVVDVVAVDDGDGPVLGGQGAVQLVDDHGAGGSRAQDHEVLRGGGHASRYTPMGICDGSDRGPPPRCDPHDTSERRRTPASRPVRPPARPEPSPVPRPPPHRPDHPDRPPLPGVRERCAEPTRDRGGQHPRQHRHHGEHGDAQPAGSDDVEVRVVGPQRIESAAEHHQ